MMRNVLFALAFMVMTFPVTACERIKHPPIKTGQMNEAQRAAFEKSYMKATHQKVRTPG
jgi:hypothetical protein